MKNKSLAADYVKRANARLLAVEVLYREKSWADVVRESQEIVELALKGLLRSVDVEIPRIHDVSGVLKQESKSLPKAVQAQLDEICETSRSLRRDRELSFYGSEDLTPSEFYTQKDADFALKRTRKLVKVVTSAVF